MPRKLNGDRRFPIKNIGGSLHDSAGVQQKGVSERKLGSTEGSCQAHREGRNDSGSFEEMGVVVNSSVVWILCLERNGGGGTRAESLDIGREKRVFNVDCEAGV